MALAANGGTAVASSTTSPYSASYVNDGSRRAVNGAIWVDGTYPTFPDWIEVDFNGSKTISEIDVITGQDTQNPVEPTLSQTFSLYGITAFDVQYWNGSAWTTVSGGSVTGNNKVWRQFTFSSITTSKIRVVVNDGADHILSRVVEVEAWTAPSGYTSANIEWVVTDQLGTPRMVFDKTGSLAAMKRHDYLPFGEEISAFGGRTTAQGFNVSDGIRQQFTEYERDIETGLDFAQARSYSNMQGRFTSPDTFGGGLGNPQSFNRYVYVTNNPTNLSDPTGHLPSSHGFTIHDQEEGGGVGSSWDDPTSPSAVLLSSGALPERYENEISDWAYQDEARNQVSASASVGSEVPQETSQRQNQPLTAVTVLNNDVTINYGQKLSATERLTASNAISAAAALINNNEDDLTTDEKKAIGQIKSLTVVGPNTPIGAAGSHGFSLDIGRIKNSSPAYLASLLGHEGQHHLNAGKYSGPNLWKDEQSAGRMQLGIGNKLGFTSAERIGLEQWIDDRNRDVMQRHMLRGVLSH